MCALSTLAILMFAAQLFLGMVTFANPHRPNEDMKSTRSCNCTCARVVCVSVMCVSVMCVCVLQVDCPGVGCYALFVCVVEIVYIRNWRAQAELLRSALTPRKNMRLF